MSLADRNVILAIIMASSINACLLVASADPVTRWPVLIVARRGDHLSDGQWLLDSTAVDSSWSRGLKSVPISYGERSYGVSACKGNSWGGCLSDGISGFTCWVLGSKSLTSFARSVLFAGAKACDRFLNLFLRKTKPAMLRRIKTKAAMTIPAILALDSGALDGSEFFEAAGDAEALEAVELESGVVGMTLLHVGGPMGIGICVSVTFAFHSVNLLWSWSTRRYVDVRNTRPNRGISFSSTPSRLFIKTSRVLPFFVTVWPWSLTRESGTTSWWLGIVIFRSDARTIVRSPSYLPIF